MLAHRFPRLDSSGTGPPTRPFGGRRGDDCKELERERFWCSSRPRGLQRAPSVVVVGAKETLDPRLRGDDQRALARDTAPIESTTIAVPNGLAATKASSPSSSQ